MNKSDHPADGPGLDWGAMADSLGPRIRLLRNVLTARSLAALEPFGLPAGSLTLMTLVTANPDCSQTELARQLGTTKSAIVALVDELERRGLARRIRSRTDRRRNRLELTQAGQTLKQTMLAAQLAQESPISAALSVQERRQLLQLLDRAHAALLRDEAARKN